MGSIRAVDHGTTSRSCATDPRLWTTRVPRPGAVADGAQALLAAALSDDAEVDAPAVDDDASDEDDDPLDDPEEDGSPELDVDAAGVLDDRDAA